MTSGLRVGGVVAAAAVLLFTMPMTAMSSETGCARFPDVPFWGALSHENVRNYVETRMSGDWTGYIEKLRKQHDKLQAIHDRGAGAVIRRRGENIKLSGKDLESYIGHADQRLAIVRCLAHAFDLDNLSNFSTAAGTPASEPPRAARPEPRVRSETAPGMERTYLILPSDLLNELRRRAVRRSAGQPKQTSVDEIVREILERELGRRGN